MQAIESVNRTSERVRVGPGRTEQTIAASTTGTTGRNA